MRPGDRIGIAALSGPVDPARLASGLEEIRRLGFEPVPAENVGRRAGLHAGSDEERLGGLDQLLSDDTLGAVVFARGGHGLLRLLPRIPWRRWSRRPRAWVGYSDLTPFLNLVPQRWGTVAFHGPMVAADFADGLDEDEAASFVGALEGRPTSIPLTEVEGPPIRGALAGGCLSLLAAVQGTPWAPRLDGRILFLEEVREPLYRFDRLLTHLGLSGTLNRLQGLVIGHLEGVGDDGSETTAEGVLTDLAVSRGWTRGHGAEAGHARPQRTIPIGAEVSLGGDSRTLEVVGPAA